MMIKCKSLSSADMMLRLQLERSLNRPVYSTADNYTLRYVLTSDNWDTPHWQVAQVNTFDARHF